MNTSSSPLELFISEFGQLSDPRRSGQVSYPLDEILFLVLSGLICDCNTWEEIEDFGLDQLDWLQTYFPYESGVPSSYTLNRVISLLDHRELSLHFSRWISSWVDLPDSTLINLDGKTARGSKGNQGKKAVHLVNAFANDLQMVLGQVATEEKSNEITAIPDLLNLLIIKGCVITLDAMGTQKAIARQIIKAGGDYVLALKNNHPELYGKVEESFERIEPLDSVETTEKNRSRLETRKVELIQDFSWIDPQIIAQWEGLQQLARVSRRRESLITGKIETEVSYYLLSRTEGADTVAGQVRGHWGVENRLHWRLDVLFGEDRDRKRAENAAANFSLFRKMTQNLLLNHKATKGNHKPRKVSVPRKRKMAARNTSFRNEIIQGV